MVFVFLQHSFQQLPQPLLFKQLWIIRKGPEPNQRALLRVISFYRTVNEDLILPEKYLSQRNDISLLLGG